MKGKLAYVMCAVAVAALLLLAGCAGAGSGESAGSSAEGGVRTSVLAAGLAATVNGRDITEDQVTEYIETFRSNMQRVDDAAWVEYLADNGATPETLRAMTIKELAAPIIVQDKARELGLSVDEEAVDAQVNGIRGSLLAQDDDTWTDELERYGTTEEQMRERYANANLQDQVFAELAKDAVPSDEDLRAYCQNNLAGSTAKRIECLYSSDYLKVERAIEAVQAAPDTASGFAQAKAQADDKTLHYIDLGWDLTAELTSGMADTISRLSKGEVDDAPLSEGGVYYLFHVVNSYTFPENSSDIELSDDALKESLSELAAKSLQESIGDSWLQQQIDENVVVSPMPEGLSYDVDMNATGLQGNAASGSAQESETE